MTRPAPGPDREPAAPGPDPEPAAPAPGPGAPGSAEPRPTGPDPGAEEPPLRVTTLELFFDLVFAFTLTQLTTLLAGRFSLAATVQVLLIFGLLWWMYAAYAWLTNTRPPVHTAERLLLLVAMAAFLVVGLAIPDGFGGSALALGLGYLVVVLVHAALYFRVNRNIIRVAPFNICSALLVIAASLLRGPTGAERPAGYALWVAALAVQLGSPLLVHPARHFELRPAHFTERHSGLLIVALGESVAAIGIGAARLTGHSGADNARLVVAAVLGLALAAALWWAALGTGDEEQAERALAASGGARRTALGLSLFYGYIPVLLGVIAMAAGVRQAVEQADRLSPGPDRAAVVLAAGAALYLAGVVAMRRRLGFGPVRLRAVTAVLALATAPIGAFVALEVQLAVLILLLAGMLMLERR
jgi:low temperature requirement protein LtrA